MRDEAPVLAGNPSNGKAPASADHFGKVATVTVVVPALNEAENPSHVLPLIPEWVREAILVDEHCTAETIAAKRVLPHREVVPKARSLGKRQNHARARCGGVGSPGVSTPSVSARSPRGEV